MEVQKQIYEVYSVDLSGVESALPVKDFIYESLDTPLAMFVDKDSSLSTGALNGREAYFYHRNPRGDIYALSNETGSVVERYDYSLFGEVFSERQHRARNPKQSLFIR
jgi:hypothetical protein